MSTKYNNPRGPTWLFFLQEWGGGGSEWRFYFTLPLQLHVCTPRNPEFFAYQKKTKLRYFQLPCDAIIKLFVL